MIIDFYHMAACIRQFKRQIKDQIAAWEGRWNPGDNKYQRPLLYTIEIIHGLYEEVSRLNLEVSRLDLEAKELKQNVERLKTQSSNTQIPESR